ncbi:carbon-nitrogen hydrolase family protein [Pelagibacterium limicola]|uniref:carbon-nitrogen hydrolase family protein n=1 Tax=Pelagibacterium limicola TaxID=2791022 RepID=UPI0018B00385|nr:carbon-nitrogen hydrolase family protein [Pelagibacterium limicola]
MSNPVRIALVQMCSGIDPRSNIEALAQAVSEAKAGGACYVLTPEMSLCFAENSEALKGRAGAWEGNADVARLSDIARDAGIWLHVGSIAIAVENGKFANRSVLFAPEGTIRATYDKIHLFDADIPGLNAYRESATYASGSRAVIADTGDFKLGFSICYDMRFGALYRVLAQGGAQVIAVPAAFTVPTGQAHWEVLLRARAIETGCFVLAAAQGGAHQNGRATYGHSLVVAPWGEVIAAAGDDAEQVVFADLDLDAIGAARQRVPALVNGRDFTLETV